jgi:hypothetical protein
MAKDERTEIIKRLTEFNPWGNYELRAADFTTEQLRDTLARYENLVK